jgi:hypothetical protein
MNEMRCLIKACDTENYLLYYAMFLRARVIEAGFLGVVVPEVACKEYSTFCIFHVCISNTGLLAIRPF